MNENMAKVEGGSLYSFKCEFVRVRMVYLMGTQAGVEQVEPEWGTPSRWVHVITALVTLVIFLGCIYHWEKLRSDASQTFGTVGLFLTAYGVLFSIIEVLRTQTFAIAAGREASRAANLARSPYDMRDAADCATMIEATIFALQNGGEPKTQPLPRIIRLYSAIFESQYRVDNSPERLRVGVVHTHIASGQRKKADRLLEQNLAEMLSDLSVKTATITEKVIEQ